MKAINGFSVMTPALLAIHPCTRGLGTASLVFIEIGTGARRQCRTPVGWSIRMAVFRLRDGADSRAEVTPAEGERDREHTHHDGADAEHPRNGQDAGEYVLKDQDAEDDGERAGEDQPPLVVDLFAHAQRRNDGQNATDDRPDGNDGGERDGSQGRVPQDEQTSDQAEDTENHQRPVTLSGWLIAESRHEHSDAVNQNVNADERHPDQWADEGQQTNDDKENAPEQENPPFFGQLERQPARNERPPTERSLARPHRASLTHTDPLYTAPRPNSRTCPCNLRRALSRNVANAT